MLQFWNMMQKGGESSGSFPIADISPERTNLFHEIHVIY